MVLCRISHINNQSLSLTKHSHNGTITKIDSPGTIISKIIALEGRIKGEGKISAKEEATNEDSTEISTGTMHPSRKSHNRKCYTNCLKTETSLFRTTKSSISLLQLQLTTFNYPTSFRKINQIVSQGSTKLPLPRSKAQRSFNPSTTQESTTSMPFPPCRTRANSNVTRSKGSKKQQALNTTISRTEETNSCWASSSPSRVSIDDLYN